MGKATGFLDYGRVDSQACEPKERIKHFREFHPPLSVEERRRQGARCMNCGVPFCQSGMTLHGMVTGCPLHNLIPEWNDEIYNGNVSHALSRLLKDKTVLIIAHRMRTVSAADQIVVLADGHVADKGAPGELYRKDGIYRQMVDLQKMSGEWKL